MRQSPVKRGVVRAIDTNIIVRLLTNDDPKQAQSAKHIVEAGDVFVGSTVLLETEWVLRAGYGFTASEIVIALRGLGGLRGVTLEEPAEAAQAIEWMEAGMDFADALHLARAGHCSAFLTFDRKLVKRAKNVSPVPVILP